MQKRKGKTKRKMRKTKTKRKKGWEREKLRRLVETESRPKMMRKYGEILDSLVVSRCCVVPDMRMHFGLQGRMVSRVLRDWIEREK
jgi:hypothetical protein